MNTVTSQCPQCKNWLTLGLDVEFLCHVWCPFCQENLEFHISYFVSLGSKAYGWLLGRKEFKVG